MPNYLQAMAGRLGSGMGIDPRRRFAQQLMVQGMDTSPAHLGTGIGRLGKALAAAYMMRQSQGQEADAMKWFTGEVPEGEGRTRPPTEAETLEARPDLEMLRLQTASPYLTDDLPFATPEITSTTQPDSIEQPKGFDPPWLRETGDKRIPPQEEDSFATVDKRHEELKKKQVEIESGAGFEEEMARIRSDPTDPFYEGPTAPSPSPTPTTGGPRDYYAKQLASGMKAYQGAEANQISDPRTRMEWLRESARGMEGNPFVSRMLQNLMFAEMQRDISQEDIKSKRAFTTSERIAGQEYRAGESGKERELKKEQMERTGWTLATEPAAGGLEQKVWIKQSTGERRPEGKPYDANLMSEAAVEQKTQIFGAKKAAMSPLQEKQLEEIEREKKKDVQEIKTIKLKDRSALQDFKRKTDTLTQTIADAESMINTYSTGFKGGVAQYLPWSTDRSRLDDYLTTLKANLGFDSLQKMRDNSKTGGALGQVSEMENKLLQAINGALNPKNPGVMQANLDRIKELYPQVLIEKTQVYQDTYGEAYDKPRDGRAGDTAGRGNVDMVWDPVKQKLVPNRRQQ